MSTHATIVRLEPDGMATSNYHHFDGGPSSLGATLWRLAQPDGPFGGDVDKMLTTLIDDHPAGWSTINDVDWSLEPGFGGYDVNRFIGQLHGTVRVGFRPQCYCHGDRSESSKVWRGSQDDMPQDRWTYAIDPVARTMLVIGGPLMVPLPFDIVEPDWAELEEA